jgi:flagellar basal-body rod protein FlgC
MPSRSTLFTAPWGNVESAALWEFAVSSSTLNIGLSGMQACRVALNVTANNVANAGTDGFQPRRAVFQEDAAGGGVQVTATAPASDSSPAAPSGNAVDNPVPSGTDLTAEMVNLLMYRMDFQASAKAVKTSDELLGTLIDTRG